MAGEHLDAGAWFALRCTVGLRCIAARGCAASCTVRSAIAVRRKKPLQLFGQPANTRLLGAHNGG